MPGVPDLVAVVGDGLAQRRHLAARERMKGGGGGETASARARARRVTADAGERSRGALPAAGLLAGNCGRFHPPSQPGSREARSQSAAPGGGGRAGGCREGKRVGKRWLRGEGS